jgi:uncharacterized membrane protein (DUF2068 family)
VKPATQQALRAIAAFEALKGLGFLVAGFVALGFMDRDNELFAEQIIRHLHVDPTWRIAQWFIKIVAEASDAQIMAVAGFFVLYAAVRFTEAYGLWRARRWAEWLAALSGGVYVPIEIYEIVHRASWYKFVALVLNLAVVAYMAWLLTESRRRSAAQTKAAEVEGP